MSDHFCRTFETFCSYEKCDWGCMLFMSEPTSFPEPKIARVSITTAQQDAEIHYCQAFRKNCSYKECDYGCMLMTK